MDNQIAVAAADPAAELHDPLAELHMEDYDTDEEQDELQEATASRLFGGGNPGELLVCKCGIAQGFTHTGSWALGVWKVTHL